MVSLQLKRSWIKSFCLILIWQWRIYIVNFWTCVPPPVQILSISCSFWEFFCKIVCWRPPRKVVAPISGETLDPPLFDLILSSNSMNSLTTYCGKIYFCGHIVKKNKVSDFKEEMSFLRITQNWQCWHIGHICHLCVSLWERSCNR